MVHQKRIHNWVYSLFSDCRFGFRQFRKSPAFTCVAVLTLALGIGANTGIFSVLRQVLLQRLPVRHPEELVLLYSPGPKQGHVSSDESSKPGEEGAESFSYPMYVDLRDHNDVFANLAAKANFSVNLAFRGQTERVKADLVSGNYFDTLGVSAAAGRTFEPEDTTVPDKNPVVLLAYAYWKRKFGGETSVLNQPILINNQPMTVVGVVQAGFEGIQPGFVPEIYIPIAMKAVATPGRGGLADHKDYWVKLIARLRPDMSRDRAAAGIAPLYSALLRNELPLNTGFSETRKAEFSAKKVILRDGQRGRPQLQTDTGPQLSALMWLVGLVLLIACANVAGLLTARGAARQKEVSIRVSLGASRFRLVRQLVIESCMLSLVGAVCGLAIAYWTSSALVHFAAENGIADGLSRGLSLPVLGFAAFLAVCCGLLFGVAPSLRASRVEPASALKEQAGTTSGGMAHQHFREALVVCQVALTLVLVTGADGFARSLFNVKHIDLGMRPSHVLQFSVDPQLNGYDLARRLAFFHELEARISALPGVLSLSGAEESLLTNSDRGSNVTVEGEPTELAGTRHVLRNAVGSAHFSNLGIPLMKGREFNDRDQPTSPKVAIVNETMAKAFFPGGDAPGRRMKFGAGNTLNIEIVGVVKNSHHSDVKEQSVPFVYIPYTQEKDLGSLTYYVRTSQDPTILAGSIRKTLNEIDSSLPVFDVRPLEEQVNRDLAGDRLIASLAEIFAALAALLAAIGIYGLLAYTVTQRTREIGVRMALGADTKRVSGMILGDVVKLVVIGFVFGLPLAYALGRLINSMLYGVKAFEALSVGAGLVVLCIVALAACYLPARRATRVDPMVALRYE